MQEVVHSLPFLVRNPNDLILADRCLGSLARSCPRGHLVLYNQGEMSNRELARYLAKFNLQADVLGAGENVGIVQGRQACFEHIWSRHQEAEYITEIHVDMIFPSRWVEGLVHFLHTRAEEPMVCPGILTARGELRPEAECGALPADLPLDDPERMDGLLRGLTRDEVREGFVHPVLHRAKTLQAVGGYDPLFLKGKQGYEDDSLLLGYRYYLGTGKDWRPKCCLRVRVYHATLAQRAATDDRTESLCANLQGLLYQYGIKGLMELAAIHRDDRHFRRVVRALMERLK